MVENFAPLMVADEGISLPFHPLADCFPTLEGKPFAELVADIQQHGVLEPVWLYDGAILDGRNRYRASRIAGVACPTRTYTGDDLVGFVVSMNLRRRHLDESQRGMVAAKLANLSQGRPEDLHKKAANLPLLSSATEDNHHSPSLSQAQAAEMLNVSERTVRDAKKVQREAAPEVVKAVDTGELTVSAALPLTTLPREEQGPALAAVKQEAAGKKLTADRVRTTVQRRPGFDPTPPADVACVNRDMQADGGTAAVVLLATRAEDRESLWIGALVEMLEPLATRLCVNVPPVVDARDCFLFLQDLIDEALSQLDTRTVEMPSSDHPRTLAMRILETIGELGHPCTSREVWERLHVSTPAILYGAVGGQMSKLHGKGRLAKEGTRYHLVQE